MDSPTSLIRALLGWATDAIPRFTNGAVTAILVAKRSSRTAGRGKLGGIKVPVSDGVDGDRGPVSRTQTC